MYVEVLSRGLGISSMYVAVRTHSKSCRDIYLKVECSCYIKYMSMITQQNHSVRVYKYRSFHE